MHLSSIHRTVAGTTIVLAGAAGLFAWIQAGERPSAAPPVSGETAFARSCARCHEREELAARLATGDPGRAVLDCLRFLEQHGDEDAIVDRAIVEFLYR